MAKGGSGASKSGAPSDRFPAGIPFIVGNEGAERFSFYGMKAILYVYLAALYIGFVDQATLDPGVVAQTKARATEVVHLFVAGVYAFPLIGAVLADRLLGKYRVIFYVSLIYCLGHAVLAVAGRFGALGDFGNAEWAMYMGLGLIAVGSGGIKPCVSANVGDQFNQSNGHLVTKVFQIFYFIINYGSFFSTLLTPYLYKEYGAEVAFGVPGILMGVATFVFWLGRDRFVKIPPRAPGKLGLLDVGATILLFSPLFATIYGWFVVFAHFDAGNLEGAAKFSAFLAQPSEYLSLVIGAAVAFVVGIVLFNVRQRLQPDPGFLAVLLYTLRQQKLRKPGSGFFSVAEEKFGQEAAEGPPAVLRIMLVFSMVSVFWALFDQHASTWVEQARQMDLALSVPAMTGKYMVGLVVGLSLLAGLWLMLWVANRSLPKNLIRGVLGLAGVGLLATIILDLTRGEWWQVNLLPSQLSALNPLMVMMIIPGLNVLIYSPLKKRGIEFRPLQKMTVGMFMSAVAFGVAALLQAAIEAQGVGKVHALWQILPYLIITTAEVLVSVTGLEFAYTQAPRAMKSTIMSFWLLCVTFGNLLVAFLAPLQKTYSLSVFFWVFTGLMAAAAVVFMTMAYFYKGKTYLQHG